MERAARWGAIVAGLGLTAIGVRFALYPEQAARAFGFAAGASGQAFYDVIALRDLWLGLLAIAFALLSEWRALALWLGLGAIVCGVDGFIAARSGGSLGPVVFHLSAGVMFATLASAALRARRAKTDRDSKRAG